MPEDEPMFSPEYDKGTSTHHQELAVPDQTPIEIQLEQAVKDEVKRYGTGKPRREIIRATIIHD